MAPFRIRFIRRLYPYSPHCEFIANTPEGSHAGCRRTLHCCRLRARRADQRRDRPWLADDLHGAAGACDAARAGRGPACTAVLRHEFLADGGWTFARLGGAAFMADDGGCVPRHVGRHGAHDRRGRALRHCAARCRPRDLRGDGTCRVPSVDCTIARSLGRPTHRSGKRTDHGGNGRVRYSSRTLSPGYRPREGGAHPGTRPLLHGLDGGARGQSRCGQCAQFRPRNAGARSARHGGPRHVARAGLAPSHVTRHLPALVLRRASAARHLSRRARARLRLRPRARPDYGLRPWRHKALCRLPPRAVRARRAGYPPRQCRCSPSSSHCDRHRCARR